VNFTDLSTGSPTSWSWDFGDGIGISSEQNPSYTYDNPGTYPVTLIATNAYGSDIETKTDCIVIIEPGTNEVHVSDITVSRQTAGKNVFGQAYVTIVDQDETPVEGAVVHGFFNAPNQNIKTDTTGPDGVALIEGDKSKSPPEDYCFEVTDVVYSGYTYNPGADVDTIACER